MNNLLTNELPESVYIDALKYPFNADYKRFIKFEIMMDDNDLSEMEKLQTVLKLFYGDQMMFIENYQEAIEQVFYMYACGEDIKNTKENKGNKTPVYSFVYDDKYIYAAFIQAYNINLLRTNMHWWAFKALLDSLPEDTFFRKIVSYRAIKIDNKMSDGERKFYTNMKKLFALPDTRTQEEKEADFIDALGF